MKKLIFEKFASDIVKAEMSKKIVGGYGDEQQNTSTSSGTTKNTGLYFTDYDCSNDGDSYSSC